MAMPVSEKQVMCVKPSSTGGNFEAAIIPNQGMLYISAALGNHSGPFSYNRRIWFEKRWNLGKIDPDKDLDGVDLLPLTALVNESPRASEIIRQARAAHPEIKIVGGGPYMGPLPWEALVDGADVVVKGEGESVIGNIADILLSGKPRDDITRMLHKVEGIAFMEDGHIVETPMSQERRAMPPDYVKLPDYKSLLGVGRNAPMLAGVLETKRGCIEHCEYCQVVRQFPGYRSVSLPTEFARLEQLQQLADEGLIYTNKNGEYSVFITDDLHLPPERATKFRSERLCRTKLWRGRTEKMRFIAQLRAEDARDPELLEAFQEVGGRMVYVGVESLDQRNLDSVHKNQEVPQVMEQLEKLKSMFRTVAMLIIGLKSDTEKSIMDLASIARNLSHYQTYNWLTPLPDTPLWDELKPLDEDGTLLPPGKRRPLHLYTGRQMVYEDNVPGRGWTMALSREIGQRFETALNHVDTLYGRMYHVMQRSLERPGLPHPILG